MCVCACVHICVYTVSVCSWCVVGVDDSDDVDPSDHVTEQPTPLHIVYNWEGGERGEGRRERDRDRQTDRVT